MSLFIICLTLSRHLFWIISSNLCELPTVISSKLLTISVFVPSLGNMKFAYHGFETAYTYSQFTVNMKRTIKRRFKKETTVGSLPKEKK